MLPPGAALADAPIADRILIALVRPHVIEDIPVTVGASIGVAQWPRDGACADDLFEFADRALCQVKAEVRAPMNPADDVALSA